MSIEYTKSKEGTSTDGFEGSLEFKIKNKRELEEKSEAIISELKRYKLPGMTVSYVRQVLRDPIHNIIDTSISHDDELFHHELHELQYIEKIPRRIVITTTPENYRGVEFLRIPDTNISVSVEYEETGNIKRDVIEKEQLKVGRD